MAQVIARPIGKRPGPWIMCLAPEPLHYPSNIEPKRQTPPHVRVQFGFGPPPWTAVCRPKLGPKKGRLLLFFLASRSSIGLDATDIKCAVCICTSHLCCPNLVSSRARGELRSIEFAEDLLLAEKPKFLILNLDSGAAVLRKQHHVSHGDVHRQHNALWRSGSGSDRNHLPLVLLLGVRVRQEDPPGGLSLSHSSLDKHCHTEKVGGERERERGVKSSSSHTWRVALRQAYQTTRPACLSLSPPPCVPAPSVSISLMLSGFVSFFSLSSTALFLRQLSFFFKGESIIKASRQ